MTGKKSINIIIKGLVQGVGFRPFVFRQALICKIAGYVKNTNEYVSIHAEGTEDQIDLFIKSINEKLPKAASISSIVKKETLLQHFISFQIVGSKDTSNRVTEISPDIAVCPECLTDMENQASRISYPFINCTNCGPRFSIISAVPYDRINTTMSAFEMCPNCRSEYNTVENRRFHAQPIGCNDCGPHYSFISGKKEITGIGQIIDQIAEFILDGKIISLKGLGGYNIICDATNEKAVSRLRSSKNREGKPFAVLFRNMDQIMEYADISNDEKEHLDSWRKPVMILKQKKSLAPSVNSGMNTIGCLLPYLPLHYLIFKKIKNPIVYTSGNVSDEPIIIDNSAAKEKLASISDALVIHNRGIHNRLDDSVAMQAGGKIRLIRRSRGYAPASLQLNVNTEGILATGAELVNCFAIGKDTRAIISQHIGDLKNFETFAFFAESIEKYRKLFRFEPALVACDLHPDYLSTGYARQTGLPVEKIQHHHAHIASCMAEYKLDETVIGISFDGTGLGDDNCIWGGEFFFCDLLNYKRYTHFDYVPLPGGDRAVEEPWRTGLSYLYHASGDEKTAYHIYSDDKIIRNIPAIAEMIKNKINSPLTSSGGRLFDAVAAITGLCTSSRFHAEAPMRLEAAIDHSCKEKYSFVFDKTIDVKQIINAVVEDVLNKKPVPLISARFHNTIISLIFAVADKMRNESGISKVVLSGGVFQNKYILEGVNSLLQKNNFSAYIPSEIPCNDGGIALGQLLISAKRREKY